MAMQLRIPQELLKMLDEVRGEKSRQAFIVNLLAKLNERHVGVKK